MSFPKVLTTNFTERLGVAAVANYANSRNILWRETPNQDFGIDGQLEYVRPDGIIPGVVVAAQVKSGPSYFSSPLDQGWRHNIAEKHRGYWESFPVPVILFLHDPNDGETYWVDVRQSLRACDQDAKSVVVPSKNRLTMTLAESIFETAGASEQPYIHDIDDLLDFMITNTAIDVSNCLSYFDLFVFGLTNICRSIYFGTDIACAVIEYNFTTKYPDLPYVPGPPAEFLFSFARFLIGQNLVHMDWSDFMIDWYSRDMIPTFIRPLTSRGRELKDAIHHRETNLISNDLMQDYGNYHVAQEAFVQSVEMSYYKRLPMVAEFQKAILSKAQNSS